MFQNYLSWPRTLRMACACYASSVAVPEPNTNTPWVAMSPKKKDPLKWHTMACCRLSHVGMVPPIFSCCTDPFNNDAIHGKALWKQSLFISYTTFLNCSPLLYQYIVSLICYHWKEIKQWFSYKISYNVQYTLSVFLHFLPQLSYSTFTFYKLSQNTHWHSKSPCQNSWTWVCMNLLSFLFCFAAHILTAIKNRHGYDWLENCVMDGCTPQVSRELERILHSIFFWNISF